MKAMWSASAIVCAMVIAACGEDGIGSRDVASLAANAVGVNLTDGATISVTPAGVAVGEAGAVKEIAIFNTGTADLEISALTIASNPPGAFGLTADPVSLAPLGSGPFVIAPTGSDEGELQLLLYVVLDRAVTASSPTAVITITSNSVNDGVNNPTIVYNVALEGGAPVIQVTPAAVDFETVTIDDGEKPRSLSIFNLGNEDLLIDGFTLSGHPNFSVVFPGMEPYKVGADTIQGILFPEPIVIEPQGLLSASVVFFASDADPAEGELVLKTNDPVAATGKVIPLQANVGGPCLALSPRKVDFGGKLVGRVVDIEVEVTSCGTKPLVITGLELAADQSSDEFSLVLDGMEGVDGTGVSAITVADEPVSLAPNESTTFKVRYVANDVSPVDGDGLPMRDTGLINIKTNSFIPNTAVEVSGFGVLVECPTAVIVIEGVEDEGEVAPQTELKLYGSQSYAATGGIAEYHWRAVQPTGSVSVFTPSADFADPKFEVNVAGEYEFELTVKDENGEPSCAPARTKIYVIPTEAIHIELLWHTPADDDETNEGAIAGSDLDLHYLHPLASSPDVDGDGTPDGWFDPFFDCFWNNEHPNWNNLSPTIDDDPDLDRDDTDGGGPENVNLNAPEAGSCYRIGVHYWEDNDFGPAYATVRVYLYATRVFEVEDVEMRERDMWSVTSVCWPADSTPPELVKVCEGTFDTCESSSDCDNGDECGVRISRNYCSPLLPCP